jgi:DNA-binding GntR family transcriptional regulator
VPKRERLVDPIQLDSYKPLRELVFETLREAIASGRLKPGQRLMELQLAEDLGVSRTPVREAIRQLELEGLVVMVPRKGAYVAELSLRDMAEVFEMRAALDGLAAALAAERITEEEIDFLERCLLEISDAIARKDLKACIEADTTFHERLYRASRNMRLAQTIANLREQIQLFRTTSLGRPGRMSLALEEHRQILEAISQRNSKLAHKLAYEHIERAEAAFMRELENKERIGKGKGRK